MLNGKLKKLPSRKSDTEDMYLLRQKGMSYKDIGAMFGMSADTVYHRIMRYKEGTYAETKSR
jgi:transposase